MKKAEEKMNELVHQALALAKLHDAECVVIFGFEESGKWKKTFFTGSAIHIKKGNADLFIDNLEKEKQKISGKIEIKTERVSARPRSFLERVRNFFS